MPAARTHRVVDDPDTLRALAHPLRLRLLGLLRLHGPATASALSRRVGESSGSTSYHLRQLARYGFIGLAADQPSRRDKVWQALHDSTTFRLPAADDPEWLAAMGTVVETQLAALADGLRRRQALAATEPREWSEAHLSSDVLVHVTAARLAELKQAVHAHLADADDPDDPSARPVLIHLHSYVADEASS